MSLNNEYLKSSMTPIISLLQLLHTQTQSQTPQGNNSHTLSKHINPHNIHPHNIRHHSIKAHNSSTKTHTCTTNSQQAKLLAADYGIHYELNISIVWPLMPNTHHPISHHEDMHRFIYQIFILCPLEYIHVHIFLIIPFTYIDKLYSTSITHISFIHKQPTILHLAYQTTIPTGLGWESHSPGFRPF